MIASQSQFTQKSLILPSRTWYHALAVASHRRPVGAIPRNSPLWVPVALTRTATRSPSEINCSTVISMSGNAWTVPDIEMTVEQLISEGDLEIGRAHV